MISAILIEGGDRERGDATWCEGEHSQLFTVYSHVCLQGEDWHSLPYIDWRRPRDSSQARAALIMQKGLTSCAD